jgi:hypothetical protein
VAKSKDLEERLVWKICCIVNFGTGRVLLLRDGRIYGFLFPVQEK